MPAKYRKHYAYKTRGDYTESYICVCLRQSDHPVKRTGLPEQPALFRMTADGEIAD